MKNTQQKRHLGVPEGVALPEGEDRPQSVSILEGILSGSIQRRGRAPSQRMRETLTYDTAEAQQKRGSGRRSLAGVRELQHHRAQPSNKQTKTHDSKQRHNQRTTRTCVWFLMHWEPKGIHGCSNAQDLLHAPAAGAAKQTFSRDRDTGCVRFGERSQGEPPYLV